MLVLTEAIYRAILDHARRELPLECVGLLGGRDGRAEVRYPIRNELSSRVRFRSDPRDMLDAFRDMRRRGIDLVAIYHSHPDGPARPSLIDQAENFYRDTPNLIVSLRSEPPVVKAFLIGPDDSVEVPWALAAC